MSNTYIRKYIKGDNSLDYQKIYKEMADITGFNSDNLRALHYNNIVNLYNEYKDNNLLYDTENEDDPK